MGNIPEDSHGRRLWLAEWAAEKSKEADDRGLLPARLRRRIGVAIERRLDRLDPLLDPFFDRGLNTADNVLFQKSENASVLYVAGPTPWHVVPRALRKLGASDKDVFVDFGCGKGRVVHQAARRPLKRVIGVEIKPAVAPFAQSLVDKNRHKYRCKSVEIVNCDAAQFPVPDDLTIAYLADPFRGETLDAVLRNLIESIDRSPRRLRLVYHPRPLSDEVLATGRFRLLPDISFGSTAIFESAGRRA